jgi:predicted Rossmann fold nucleotide-binding protein DprA/Smf involved in DNA uptake
MALTTLSEMKQEILENWAQFADNAYPEDLLAEFADSALPAYTNDIIQEWQHMPSEFDDYWQELELPKPENIIGLMQIDLSNYYLHLANTAYSEICAEMPTPEED